MNADPTGVEGDIQPDTDEQEPFVLRCPNCNNVGEVWDEEDECFWPCPRCGKEVEE